MNTQAKNNESTKHCIHNRTSWQRLIFMVLFAVLLHLASAVMWVLCALQFLFTVMTGQDNSNLRSLGSSIAQFIHQSLRFVSYNSQQKPFPFSPWPEPEPEVDTSASSVADPVEASDAECRVVEGDTKNQDNS